MARDLQLFSGGSPKINAPARISTVLSHKTDTLRNGCLSLSIVIFSDARVNYFTYSPILNESLAFIIVMTHRMKVPNMWKSLLLLAALMFAGHPALASDEALPAPTGEIVLTVTGGITNSNAKDSAVFDMDLLRSLGETTVKTSTVWTDGIHTYSGVSLKTLLDRLGVTQGSLEMVAVNDYLADVPLSDATEGGPIVAYAVDGVAMPLRDKGPLWLIYPYDSDIKYRTEEIYARSIWQLNRINVVPAP